MLCKIEKKSHLSTFNASLFQVGLCVYIFFLNYKYRMYEILYVLSLSYFMLL